MRAAEGEDIPEGALEQVVLQLRADWFVWPDDDDLLSSDDCSDAVANLKIQAGRRFLSGP